MLCVGFGARIVENWRTFIDPIEAGVLFWELMWESSSLNLQQGFHVRRGGYGGQLWSARLGPRDEKPNAHDCEGVVMVSQIPWNGGVPP